jgi:murein DD-endopeptidase MepM/ murein hydrolase activator NlpD
MCKIRLNAAVLCGILLIAGCEREELSPVDIKIDENMGHTEIGQITPSGSYHIVKGGETLFDVANKYNIDPINLAKINGIKPPYKVKDGQVLKLPDENLPQEENAESRMPQYEQLEEKVKEKDELEDEFAGVMSTKGKASAVSPANAATSFNEQENLLSVPKVTKNAVGASTNGATATKTVASTSDKMISPVNGKIISRFGDVKDGIANDGINIKAALGTPVKAAASGDVIYSGNKLEEYGNTVIIQHPGSLITSYAHLDKIKTKSGTAVNAGDVIGTVGKTGDVTEPQLHFEVLKNKTPVDPAKYLGKAQ